MTVRLVCGPPCSGKSTFVQENAQPGDLVVDYDRIAQSFGSKRTHNHDFKYHRRTQAVVTQLINEVAAGKHENAWVVQCLPDGRRRAEMAQRLNAEVHVMDVDATTLRQRASTRPDVRKTLQAIAEWRAVDAATADLASDGGQVSPRG